MALSENARRRVIQALARKEEGLEVLEALEASGTAAVAEAVADVAVADATDEIDVVALANANKAKINELLASLRAAGLLAE